MPADQFAALLVATCLSQYVSVRAGDSHPLSMTHPLFEHGHTPRHTTTQEPPVKRLPFGGNASALNHRQISVVQRISMCGTAAAAVSASIDRSGKDGSTPPPSRFSVAAESPSPDDAKESQLSETRNARYAEIVADHLDLQIGMSWRDGEDASKQQDLDLSSQPSPLSEHSALTVANIERVARVKLEPQARRYFFSGADRQQTLKENTAAFERLRFRPKFLVDVSRVDTTTSVLGHRISMPIGFAPAAMQKLAHKDGEAAAAQAAQDARTVMILSSLSTTSLEEVRRKAPRCLLWFQAYLFRDRSVTEWMVKRAARAGYSAIVLTADSPVVGHKLGPAKNRFVLPPNVTFANLEGWHEKSNIQSGTQEDVDGHISRAVSWQDIGWLKKISGLPIVAKGVLTRDAALQAYHHGAAAILVSNHGGRQLDGTPATIEALPEIVSAIRGRLEIYLDSGVRSGADVVKALSLGARAVFVGRPLIWGLAYNGKQGVDRVLEILRTELERTIKLLGCKNSSSLNSAFVVHKNHYARTTWRNFPRHDL
ncbi:uncharacterized protein [Dermacentor albipictus]|uniref:uncharacterized protein n=1 Tax=Dermacentor albipictus TaxID=60249 RepID=UPI0038FC199B